MREEDRREKPARPVITAVLACACFFWAACAGSYYVARTMAISDCLNCALAAIAVSLLVAAVALVLHAPTVGFVVLSVLVGLCFGFSAALACHDAAVHAALSDDDEIELTLLEDSKEQQSGESALARIGMDDGASIVVQVSFKGDEAYLSGDRLKVMGGFSKVDGEHDEYLWQKGAVGTLRARTVRRLEVTGGLALLRNIRSEAIRKLEGQDAAHAMLQALICGYRHDLTATALYARFQACGLAHLIAVSGAHLVIVTNLVAVLLGALHLPRRITVFLLIAVMVSYIVIAGLPVSAIRAAIMSSVGLMALMGRRRPSSVNALGLGIFAIIGVAPQQAVSVSFALSALSTMGIVLFAPLVRFWLTSTPLARIPAIADMLSLTLAANMLSQPFSFSVFHMLPLVGPLANIACAPLLPLVCVVGLICVVAACVCVPLAPVAIQIATGFSGVLAFVVGALSSGPVTAVPVSIESVPALAFSAAIACALWITWPTPKARVVVPCMATMMVLVLCIVLHVMNEDAIIMLDVGQGDSFFIRSRGESLLIDTGNRDSQLLSQLGSCCVPRIDSVLVTHNDDDHCGSLDALRAGVSVDRVLVAEGMLESDDTKCAELVRQARDTARTVEGLRLGDRFSVGAFLFEVVGPLEFSDGGGNADSVCLLMSYDADYDGHVDFTALFTGDAESGQLQDMLDAGLVADVDILKVGHHGSEDAVKTRQVKAMGPMIALIGVGEGNRYGHPSEQTLDALESQGCVVYRTDRDGQVKCTFTCDSVLVGLQ